MLFFSNLIFFAISYNEPNIIFQFTEGIDFHQILLYFIYCLSFTVYVLVNFAVPLNLCRNYYL